jgi:hypothetical protein
MKQKVLIMFLMSMLFVSIASATTLYGFKKDADSYVISQVGQKYFSDNFEYLGDKTYPENTPDSNMQIVQYNHKIKIGDYIEDIKVTVWFNFKNGIWEIGNGYNTQSEGLPDCISDTTKCMPFEITREKAIEIAKENGAFKNAEKYTAKIHYFYGNINSYVWDITTYESAFYGKTAIIDVNTGKLISIWRWQFLVAQEEYNDATSIANQQDETINQIPPTKKQDTSSNIYLYLIAGIGLVIIFFVILFIKRNKNQV